VGVTGVSDPLKGEALVLLSAVEVSVDTLRRKLAEHGFPNLWIPRIIRRVERIPLLGSGKLDLKACRNMALASCRTYATA